MKISHNWLKDYIKTDLPPEDIAEILTDTGLEVEGLEKVESIRGGLKGVVIGEVKSCIQHPNADRLKLTTVDIDGERELQIVCGAPNVAAGQKVLVATVGTTIYTDDGSFEIKKAKLRGETSEGMICAEDELGLGESHDGILVLDPSVTVGTEAADHFKVDSDHVYEIGLTPNRTDAMSHFGVARDLRAALLRRGESSVDCHLPSITSFSVTSADLPVDVHIEDEDACLRYTGVSLKNVKVEESPLWLQNRLRAIGLGPINNVVDITNYVLHETGHPLHAFDLEEVKGEEIIVKKLPAGTKFTTLDDKERVLDQDDLMICDKERGLVLAGVFGGKNSGVTSSTNKVFLEAAYFDSVGIRKSAKRHGLNTDSSFRYERGVDPEMTLYTLQRAALMIRDIAGGEISMNIIDVHPKHITRNEVKLNLTRMNQLIGKDIEPDMVKKILHALDFQIKAEGGGELLLQVPTYRVDVTREADVIEEVLRIYGFNNIPLPEKMNISIAENDIHSSEKLRELASKMLSARGFQEIMNNSLTKPEYHKEEWSISENDAVQILNPLSRDLEVMRQNLLFGGLESIHRNINRQRSDLRFFEFGKTYQDTNSYQEYDQVGLWVTGNTQPENWKNPLVESDFYTTKSELIQFITRFGINDWSEEESDLGLFSTGIKFTTNGHQLADLGMVKQEILSLVDVKQDVYYAQINWPVLVQLAKEQKIQFRDLPKYPQVRRDLALLVNSDVRYQDLRKTAIGTEKKLLRKVDLFDVYEGTNLPEGKKSYALSFIFRDDEQTLNDKAVEKVMADLLAKFKKNHQAELR